MLFRIRAHPSKVQAGFHAVACVAAALGVWVAGAGLALAPQPATTTAELGGANGVTGAAIYTTVNTKVILKWPSLFTAGSSAPAGTPCSNVALPVGAATTMHIQVLGFNRRCVPTTFPPIPGQTVERPYPPPTVATARLGTVQGNSASGVRIAVVATIVIKWPTTWHAHINNAVPEPGTPCSPTNMLAGESTTMHIQGFQNASSSYRRCVPNTEPIWSP